MIVTFDKGAQFYHVELDDGITFQFTPELIESLQQIHDMDPLAEIYEMALNEAGNGLMSIDELNQFKTAYENCSH